MLLTLKAIYLKLEVGERKNKKTANHPNDDGIYYIYNQRLTILPTSFTSKQASWYLGAIELMSLYRRNRFKLRLVSDWLESNQNESGRWDMGSGAKDGVYFPLSDTWRQKINREMDCTYRIKNILFAIAKTE